VDLDGDGDQDLLSGSWPGELFFFRRGADGTFAAPIELQDADGGYLNIGGGVTESDDQILITGNAEFVDEDGRMFAVYHGRRIESTAERGVAITGTASAVHACDWDADGDFDLIVGDIGGNVHLIPNEGTATEWRFGRHRELRAGGAAIRVGGDAGPYAADWDGDGDLDLLVGDGDGTVSLFDNVGTRAEPRLAPARVLVQGHGWQDETPAEPRCGMRVKVCVADWNGDGRLDLLMGDYASLKPDLPEPTAEEAAQHEVLRAELEELNTRYGRLVDQLYGRGRIKDPDERQRLEDEFGQVRDRLMEVQQSLPPEEESHGWIWFFARQ